MTACRINFAHPPKVGDTLAQGGQVITVTAVRPYVRRDGSASHLIGWQGPDGRVGVSGLVSRDVRWGQTVDEALRLSAEARARRAAQPDADVSAKPPAPPKARLGIRIDPDLADRLKGVGNMSAFISAAIRDALDRQEDG